MGYKGGSVVSNPNENPIDAKLLKRVIWFSLSFVFLVIVALLLEGPWSGKRKERPREATLFVADTSSVSEMFIKEGTDSVNLRKVQGSWMVFKPGNSVGYKADMDEVKRALTRLTGMKGEVISSKPEKYSLFEVSDSQALFVRVKNKGGDVIGELYLGKTGPDFSSTYVRAKGRKDVILADGFLRPYFFADLGRWRNRKIISFKPSAVVKFALYSSKGDSLKIEKSDSGWFFSTGERVDSTKIAESIRYLGNLRALGFGDTLSPEVTGLGNPNYTVKVVLNDGRVITLYIGNKLKKPERYAVMTEGDSSVYLASTFAIDKFLRQKKEYLPAPKKEKAIPLKKKPKNKK